MKWPCAWGILIAVDRLLEEFIIMTTIRQNDFVPFYPPPKHPMTLDMDMPRILGQFGPFASSERVPRHNFNLLPVSFLEPPILLRQFPQFLSEFFRGLNCPSCACLL